MGSAALEIEEVVSRIFEHCRLEETLGSYHRVFLRAKNKKKSIIPSFDNVKFVIDDHGKGRSE